MAYLGSTPTTQSFIAGTDSFNGTGSQTDFTLSRFVNSTNDIQVVVNNVVQYPPNYSVSGNTLTISPAPSSGTNNVYVRYLSTTLQSIAPSQGIAIQFGTGSASLPSISFIGDTNTGIFSPAADTVAISTNGTERVRVNGTGTITYTRTTLASYLWSTWNPTDVTGTVTTAPSTGTINDSDYVTLANSSGTVTVTFDVAGTYMVNLQASTAHSNGYAYDTFYFNFGGNATLRTDRASIDIWGDSVNDGNLFSGFPVLVTATASQTLTVQPQYRVSGSGTTSNHNAVAAMTVQYCGG